MTPETLHPHGDRLGARARGLHLRAWSSSSASIRIIPQATAGVVERLGRYHKTLMPG